MWCYAKVEESHTWQSRYNNYGPPQGAPPLRENTYAREANVQVTFPSLHLLRDSLKLDL